MQTKSIRIGILISILPLLLYAQQEQFSFSHIGETDGLYDNRDNSFIYKDSMGFVWISSQSGCYRFDGQSLKQLTINPEQGYDQNIQSDFFEDEDHNLWFTTANGLHTYVRATEQFVSQTFTKDGKGLNTPYFLFHLDIQQQVLWLGNPDYVWAWNYKTKKMVVDYLPSRAYRFTVKVNSSGEVEKIYGFLWDVMPGMEIWEKDDQNNWRKSFLDKGPLQDARISGGILENDTTLWLISDIGLIDFDTKKRGVRKVYLIPSSKVPKVVDAIWYNNYQLLVASKADGLWLFDTQQKTYTSNWVKDSNNDRSLSSNEPHYLYRTKDNELWVSHKNVGLDYASMSTLPFRNPMLQVGKNIEIKTNGILEDSLGRIWVLTEREGLCIFSPDEKLLTQFKSINELSFLDFTYISIDKDGTIWLTCKTNIYQFDSNQEFLDKKHWEEILCSEIELTSLYQSFDDSIIVTSPTGIYYFILSSDGNTLKKVPFFDKFNSYEFYLLYELNEDYTLAPYNNYDLWLLDKTKNSFRIRDSFFLEAVVFDVLPDADGGKGWIGSDKGLFKYIIDDKKGLNVKQEKLFSNYYVYAVERDLADNLWLLTSHGIWTYNSEEKLLTNYNRQDGLSANIFVHGASLRTSQGKFWFGNKNGLTVFDPSEIKLPESNAHAYIDQFWVNQLPFEFDSLSVNSRECIELAYTPQSLEFELRTTNISPDNRYHLRYRLLNYNNNWSYRKSGNTVQFNTIPPGGYVLEVQPVDDHHKFGETQKLNIIIPVPIYQRWWFRLLLIAFILVLIIGSVRLYYARQLRIQKELLARQQAITKERNRISKELHDDMGSGLSSILFISEEVLLDSGIGKNEDQLTRINSLSKEALYNMKDIVWALDTAQSTLEDLVLRVYEQSFQFLSDYQIRLLFKKEIEGQEKFTLSSEVKRNLILIIKECFNNTVKHAHANKVSLSFKIEDYHLLIEIKDNGCGFDKSLKRHGNGLKNIAYRSKAINAILKTQSITNVGTEYSIKVPLYN